MFDMIFLNYLVGPFILHPKLISVTKQCMRGDFSQGLIST